MIAKTPASEPPSRRKRGAQPRNRNSIKHGYYASGFREDEFEDLEVAMAHGLQEEIDMLRMVIRRSLIQSRGNQDPRETLNLLDHMGKASVRLATLLHAQKILGEDPAKTAAALETALSGLVDEIRMQGRRTNLPSNGRSPQADAFRKPQDS